MSGFQGLHHICNFTLKYTRKTFLSHTNKVWNKVIFSQVSVYTRGVGLCTISLPVWLPDPVSLRGGGGWGGEVAVQQEGVSVGIPLPWNQKSRWYVSYWNVFLLILSFRLKVTNKISGLPHSEKTSIFLGFPCPLLKFSLIFPNENNIFHNQLPTEAYTIPNLLLGSVYTGAKVTSLPDWFIENPI